MICSWGCSGHFHIGNRADILQAGLEQKSLSQDQRRFVAIFIVRLSMKWAVRYRNFLHAFILVFVREGISQVVTAVYVFRPPSFYSSRISRLCFNF